jgi:hypothetical protein
MSLFTYFNYYCMTNYEKRINKIIKYYFNKKKKRTTLLNLTSIIYRQKKRKKISIR